MDSISASLDRRWLEQGRFAGAQSGRSKGQGLCREQIVTDEQGSEPMRCEVRGDVGSSATELPWFEPKIKIKMPTFVIRD